MHAFAAEWPAHAFVLLIILSGEVVLMTWLSVLALMALVVYVESTGVACPPIIVALNRIRLEASVATLLLVVLWRTVGLDCSRWSGSWLVLVDGSLTGSLLGSLALALVVAAATTSALVPTAVGCRRRGNIRRWSGIGRGDNLLDGEGIRSWRGSLVTLMDLVGKHGHDLLDLLGVCLRGVGEGGKIIIETPDV